MSQNDNQLGEGEHVTATADFVPSLLPSFRVKGAEITSTPPNRLLKLLRCLPKLQTEPFDPSKSLTEFHLFPRLPIELRCQIIEKTDIMTKPTRIEIDRNENLLSSCFFRLKLNQQSALEVNVEFRKVALAVFTPLEIRARHEELFTIRKSKSKRTKIYVKLKIDTLVVCDQIFPVRAGDYILKWPFSSTEPSLSLHNYEFLWSQKGFFDSVVTRALDELAKFEVKIVLGTSRDAYWVTDLKKIFCNGRHGNIVGELILKHFWIAGWNVRSKESGYLGMARIEDVSWRGFA